jgi:hypothetical protein
MSYLKIDNLLPNAVRGKTIGGFNVSDEDQRGGTFVDHLNLSTRFVRGDYGDLAGMLKSPYHWRGSHKHEGTVGTGDFLNYHGTDHYMEDPTLGPSSMTEGKGRTIDFHVPVIVVEAAHVKDLIAYMSTQASPVYNHGDWDTADVKDPEAVTGAVKYGIKDVSEADVTAGKINPGRHYIYIDVSDSGVVLPAEAATNGGLALHKFYRPIMVVKDYSDWDVHLTGFVGSTIESTLKYTFTPHTVLHECMDFVAPMFTLDFVKKSKMTHQEPYVRFTLPPAALTVSRIEDSGKNGLKVSYNTFDTTSTPTTPVIKEVDYTINLVDDHVKLYKEADEPITDIWAELLTPPNFTMATQADPKWSTADKRRCIRVFARTHGGYNFLLRPEKYTVELSKPKATVFQRGMRLRTIVKLSPETNPLERKFITSLRGDENPTLVTEETQKARQKARQSEPIVADASSYHSS